MKGFMDDIETRTVQNLDYRRVVYTGKHMQLVLMCLQPGEDIGEETHDDVDQFFRVEAGTGKVVIDGRATNVDHGTAIVVPAGARHNVRNTADAPLKLYTLYAPPEHADRTVQVTKVEAAMSHEHFDGVTTE